MELPKLDAKQLIHYTNQTAKELDDSAISRGADGLTRLGLNYVAGAQCFQFQPLGHSLYDGYAGVAVFLAGLYSVTGNQEQLTLVDIATKALRMLRANDDEVRRLALQKMGIGRARRLGSIVYVLILIAELCEQTTYLNEARLAAEFISGECVANAIETIRHHPMAAVDHACCGNFGLIESLLGTSQKLKRPDLHAMALANANQVLARSHEQGGYSLFANLSSGVGNPGFFQRSSGIGYGLLRLAFPERLPSVLLWQS